MMNYHSSPEPRKPLEMPEPIPANLLEAARIVAEALARRFKISLDKSPQTSLYPFAKEAVTP